MNLFPGKNLGPYEIIELAGAGGMGEVYKATDTRLGRTVAVKVLPEGGALRADFRARFEREAKAISGLNHPSICTLYDIGHEGAINYFVMEYLEGETLSDRLKRGPMEVAEAAHTAGEIAAALDAAHTDGLVHRDLKPGNVMLTPSGPKLLDFGLAKLQTSGGEVAGETTLTGDTPLTGSGTLVGTVPYMSPEQLEGHDADPRSDIFAFGAMLYEMLTGRRAFTGKTHTSLVASILKETPESVSDVNPRVSPALNRLVEKCLNKDPESRWQSARDLADELRWIADSGLQESVAATNTPSRRRRVKIGWALAGLVAVVAVVLTVLLISTAEEEQIERRLEVSIEELTSAHWPRLSPNGKYIVFRAADEVGTMSLWLRPMDAVEAVPVPDTRGVSRPFWSPDSKWVAFFQNNVLKRVSVSGGPTQEICNVVGGADGSWGKDNIILFDGSGYSANQIRQVPATGGRPVPATKRSAAEQAHSWPLFLPDGRTFLFAVDDTLATPTSNLLLKAGSLDSEETKEIARVDSRVEYMPPGYLLYLKDNTLVAHPFDLDNLKLTGDPIPIDTDILTWSWGANFSTADDGTLAYQKGTAAANDNLLLWFDRNGNVLDTIGKPDLYRDIALSPDGDKLAFSKVDRTSGTEDVWIFDLARQVPSRFTFDSQRDIYPSWSPDGEYVVFTSNRSGRDQIYRKPSSGIGEAEVMYENPDGVQWVGVGDWTADRDELFVYAKRGDYWSMGVVDLLSEGDTADYVDLPYHQWTMSLSPDGRYMVYSSTESGRYEIYVRNVDGTGRKWQISAEGGYNALWSRDGTEIFWSTPDDEIWVAQVNLTDGFEPGQPRRLFSTDLAVSPPRRFRYQPSHDGQRILINYNVVGYSASDFVIVLNWRP